MHGPERAALALAAVLLALPAHAVLGEDAASIQADALQRGSPRRIASGLAMQVHTLTLPDGSTVREYVNPAGRVFAVAWNTRGKPRLDRLLGTHFAAYAEAGRSAMQQRPGVMHGAAVQRGDLVVEATAHLNAHVGRAWLRSQLPPGTPPDAIR